MDIFTRNKFLLRIILVLIFLNLFSIGYLWWQKSEGPEDRQPRKGKDNPKQILKEKLHLRREQETAIVQLRADFSGKEEAINQVIKSQRDSMNRMMFHTDVDTASLKKIARRVAENEYLMELYRIDQAQKLKGICTPEQIKEFEHLVINIRDFLQPKKKKE